MENINRTNKEFVAEAKAMQLDIRSQGGNLTLAECKTELLRTYKDNKIEIIK